MYNVFLVILYLVEPFRPIEIPCPRLIILYLFLLTKMNCYFNVNPFPASISFQCTKEVTRSAKSNDTGRKRAVDPPSTKLLTSWLVRPKYNVHQILA